MSLSDLTLPVVLGLAGVVLVMAGVLGKRFVFLQSKIPETAGLLRFASLLVGATLIALSVTTFTIQVKSAAQSTHDPGGGSDPTISVTTTTTTTDPTTTTTTTRRPPRTTDTSDEDDDPTTTTKTRRTTTTTTTTTTRPASGMVLAGGVKVYDDPSLSAEVVGFLPAGRHVSIYCTARGDTVQNYSSGHASNLWDRVDDGYVPDVMVNTGTDAPTRGTCR